MDPSAQLKCRYPCSNIVYSARPAFYTKNSPLCKTVKLEENTEPMVPGPAKVPLVSATSLAQCAEVDVKLLDLCDDTPAKGPA